LGPEHPSIANSLNNLATLYDAQGAYGKAEPLLRRSLAITEKVLGPEHPTTALALNNLAQLYRALGVSGKAEPLLHRSIASQVLFLQREIPLLSVAQRQAQVGTQGPTWQVAFSGAVRSPRGAALALFSRLNRHGLLLEIERRQALLARDPAYRQLADRIAALTVRLAGVNLPTEQRQVLQSQRAQLEQQLYRQLPALQPRLVEPEQVARALPAGGVLLEFQRYQPFDGRQPEGKRWGEARYLALLLGSNGTISATDLGTAAPIEARIQQALAITEAGQIDPAPAWRGVSQAVFPAELLSRLSAYQRWFLSPDGELNRIPFAALPSPTSPDQRLVETIQLRLITSGRDLVPLPQASAPPPSQQPVVLADPDFGGDRPWQRLPASAAEGQQIGARLYQRQQATTAALQRSISPKLLHVASHGFFSSPEAPKAAAPPPPRGSRSAFAGPPGSREDAMLNSGIVLAGANRSATPSGSITNQPESEADDGYLTAKEAAQLQLEGTELVVLSACDTASGEQRSGEGVYGLQRGLTVAGARSTLLSLWKVDDAATAHFMRRYYTLLQQGKGRMEALLAVQQEFREGVGDVRREWADAKVWAAWQLSGETGPLPGLRGSCRRGSTAPPPRRIFIL
jgi:CHAT domain-containing protein